MNHPATSIPERFDDNLAKRIFPIRFRRIGNPFAFLNDVGITPILEYIYKGNLLIDVAEVLNVSMTILRTWVENEGHGPAIEEAEKLSAEGYLADGMRRMRTAENAFELKRAQEMIKHAQFMASKKDKRQYGAATEAAQGAGVSYVFNINGSVSSPQEMKQVVKVVEQIQDALPVVSVDLNHLLALDKDPSQPIGAIWGDTDTTDGLDIGPFYDEAEPSP